MNSECLNTNMTIYINGFVDNSSFQQSKLESSVLQNMRVIELKTISDLPLHILGELN